MKRIILIGLLLASCQAEDPQPTMCDCYKQYQQLYPGGSWLDTYQDGSETESCDKNGQVVQTTTNTRYKWVCQ